MNQIILNISLIILLSREYLNVSVLVMKKYFSFVVIVSTSQGLKYNAHSYSGYFHTVCQHTKNLLVRFNAIIDQEIKKNLWIFISFLIRLEASSYLAVLEWKKKFIQIENSNLSSSSSRIIKKGIFFSLNKRWMTIW